MNKEKPRVTVSDITDKVSLTLRKLRRYSLLMFIALVAIIYGFLLLRVSSLSNTQPSSDAVSSQVKAAHLPRINPVVVQQLQSLQDNSVSVKALFNQARSNPFQ